MDCSYCSAKLSDDEASVPNIFLENKAQRLMLALHPECIKPVIERLRFAERMVVN